MPHFLRRQTGQARALIDSLRTDNYPVRFFVAFAILFGLIFLVITPPFETPDEPAHFMRAYQISEGNFVVDEIGTSVGGMLPASINDTVSLTTTNPDIMFHPENKYSLARTRQALKIKLQPDRKLLYSYGAAGPYSPVSYIPQSSMMLVGRLLSLPPVVAMYLGRLANLATWILLVGLAIHFAPKRKWAFAFIGLLPMALFEAVSLSADVSAIGLLALLLALVLKVIDEDKIMSSRAVFLLLAVVSLLALSKQAMFIFVVLIMLIPGRLLPSTLLGLRFNRRVLQAMLMVFPLALAGIWMYVIRGISVIGNAVNGQNPSLQIGYIHHHLFSYAVVVAKTYLLPFSDSIAGSFIGNFGWMDTPLPEFVVIVGFISMLIIFTGGIEKGRVFILSNFQKVILVGSAALYGLAASTALYLYFSPVGARTVWGIVGRYLLPIALLLIPLCSRNWFRFEQKNYVKLAKAAPIFLLSYGVLIIIYRYYVY